MKFKNAFLFILITLYVFLDTKMLLAGNLNPIMQSSGSVSYQEGGFNCEGYISRGYINIGLEDNGYPLCNIWWRGYVWFDVSHSF